MTRPHIEPLFDAEVIHRQVAELGAEIGREVADHDPLLIAILGGSVIFLADLVRAIAAPVRYEFIEVGFSKDAPAAAPEVVRIEYPIPIDVEGQNLLVLKDVVSTGVVEAYLDQQLKDHGARRVRCAALIDIPRQRKTDFSPDHKVFEIDRSGHLVGYGLKYHGRYGNLPYVGVISEDGRSP